MSLWAMIPKEHDQYNLRRQFNKEFYETIKAFQGKWIIIVPIHMEDLQAKGEETLLRQCLNQTHKRNKTLHDINLSHKSFLAIITQLRNNFQMNNKLQVLGRGLML
jgi:hypothetical protein